MPLSTTAAKLVMKQVKDLLRNPIDGVELLPPSELTMLEATIAGPADTPFEGGTFSLVLVLSDNYPAAAPTGYFRTKLFHPNVGPKGEICVNTLKRDWDPTFGLRHILTVIKCLLVEPNPESALNEEAGRLLLEDYNEYAARCRMYTTVHAGGTAPTSAHCDTENPAATADTEATTAPAPAADTKQLSSCSASTNNTSNNAAGTRKEPAKKEEKKQAVDKKRAALRRL